MSALRLVLSHIISDILESDLESRYTDVALSCLVDLWFKGNFSYELKATVNCCIEEASKLTEIDRDRDALAEQTSTIPQLPLKNSAKA